MGMATKNISLTEEAYSRLASYREGDESFSEIINKLTKKRNLMDFAGVISKESAKQIKSHIAKQRARVSKETEARRKELLREIE